MKKTILFLFNSSKYAPEPWVKDGRFNVVSVDYDDTDHSGAHVKGGAHYHLNIDLSKPNAIIRITNALGDFGLAWPSLVVSFAPCTDLAVSGAAHFARKLEADPDCQVKAANMAKLASKFSCPYAVENPVSVLSSLWRKPDIYFDPIDFSAYVEGEHPELPDIIPARDAYFKRTCLWTGNGFMLPEKRRAESLLERERAQFHGHVKLGGKSARTKYIRSLTPRGLAKAIYEANKESI